MNCPSIRNRVLVLDCREELPMALASHISSCGECQAWLHNLQRVERAIPQVPVPASNGQAKAALLQAIRAGKPNIPNHKPVPKPKAKPVPASERVTWREFAARNWSVSLIAATILIGTLAWMSLRPNRPLAGPSSPADPMLDGIVQANLEVAEAKTADVRIQALAKLADELHREMRDIARVDTTGENMAALQQMYTKVVSQGILSQARPALLSGTPAEKKEVLETIASRLTAAEKQAEQLANEVPQVSVRPLREAAEAARRSTMQIRKLMEEV